MPEGVFFWWKNVDEKPRGNQRGVSSQDAVCKLVRPAARESAPSAAEVAVCGRDSGQTL